MMWNPYIKARQRGPCFLHSRNRWEEAPEKMYFAGDFELIHALSVAIIGTREPTQAGMKTAYNMSYYFAKRGIIIVSGLALGIDTQAHQAAIDARGRTIAVLGSPLYKVYPPENLSLAEEIVKSGGLLLSAYDSIAYGDAGRKRFIERDHVQAALSRLIIPIQARTTGGTRHAVQWALKHHKAVMVPYPIAEDEAQHPEAYGLIRQLIDAGQAGIIRSKDDYPQILENLRNSHDY